MRKPYERPRICAAGKATHYRGYRFDECGLWSQKLRDAGHVETFRLAETLTNPRKEIDWAAFKREQERQAQSNLPDLSEDNPWRRKR